MNTHKKFVIKFPSFLNIILRSTAIRCMGHKSQSYVKWHSHSYKKKNDIVIDIQNNIGKRSNHNKNSIIFGRILLWAKAQASGAMVVWANKFMDFCRLRRSYLPWSALFLHGKLSFWFQIICRDLTNILRKHEAIIISRL